MIQTTSHKGREVGNGKRSGAGNPACNHAMWDEKWEVQAGLPASQKKPGGK